MRSHFRPLFSPLIPMAVAVLVFANCVQGSSSVVPAPLTKADLDWRADHLGIDLGFYAPVQRRPDQSPEVAVAVAISGGGLRAANFAIGVLQELERYTLEAYPAAKGRHLLGEVDYFSTVSGGTLAAGTYLSALFDTPPDQRATFSLAAATAPGTRRFELLHHNYELDLLTPSFLENGQLERGDALERAIDNLALGAAARPGRASFTMGDVFKRPSERPDLPYWFPNTTLVGTGAVLSFTPDRLSRLQLSGYYHDYHLRPDRGDLGDRDRPALSEAEIFSIPFSVAAKASASFPGIVAASTLVTNVYRDRPYVHLMDGGVGDNLGYRTALMLLRDEPAPRKLLIVIDAYRDLPSPFSAKSLSPTLLEQAISAADSPLNAARARVREQLRSTALMEPKLAGLEYVIIDFDALAAREGSDEIAVGDRLLARDARAVGTRFFITSDQQVTLLKAAHRAVQLADGDIQSALHKVFGKK